MLLVPVVLFCAGEVCLRVYQLVRAGVPLFEATGKRTGNLSPLTIDDELGWRATEGYRSEETEKTAGGREYVLRWSQEEHGFRMFGDIHSLKPKILVIGDSFTQAVHVSDGKPYYALLKSTLDVEVFAYGGGGYGTLQEYLVLDRYVDRIKPDLIVWQYCINDFINNDPGLETASRFNNNGMRRPYWVDRKIVMVLPKNSWERTREFANRYSRFLYFILARLDRLRARFSPESVEKEIERLGFNHPGFLRSIQVTDDLMGRVRARAGNVPFVAFSCKNRPPYNEALQTISSHHGIVFLDIGGAVQGAEAQGKDVLAGDKGHWNEEGHRIAGEALTNYLQSAPVYAARPSTNPKWRIPPSGDPPSRISPTNRQG